jgi:chromosome segregation ATPase
MEQLHKDLQADFESTLATSQDTEQQVIALRKERDVLLQQREDANERHEQDNNAWRAAVRKAEEAARKAAEEASSHARTVETLSMQIKNKDLALEQLQRDKESATVTKEELRTQMQSLSDDQSNTHAKAYALQKHAEKLESTLRECEDDLELQHVQTRNAQARVTALEHEVDAAQDLVRIAEAKVNSMAAENAQLTRESEELKKEVLTHRSESRKLRSLEVPVLTAMHKHKNRYMHKHRSSNFSPKMAMGEDSSLRLYLQESLSQESHSNLRQMKQAQAQVVDSEHM